MVHLVWPSFDFRYNPIILKMAAIKFVFDFYFISTTLLLSQRLLFVYVGAMRSPQFCYELLLT